MGNASVFEGNILSDYEFYAPEFLVEINGRELDPATKGDILQVKVVMDIDNMTGFELTLNNWDDDAFDFKYTNDRDLVDLCGLVSVRMGYAEKLLSMVEGRITSISPRFPESGPPSLGVSGQDGMIVLRDRKPADGEPMSYRNLTDGQIAQRIAERNQLGIEADTDGPVHELVVQRNQDDATFLMERAKRIDYDVFVRTDPDSGESTLHFVKPTDGRDGRPIRVYELVWGESLINFTPTMTAAHQVSSVTVRGWNARTKSVITYTSTEDDLPNAGSGTSGPAAAACLGPGRQEVTIDAPVASEDEARELARSLLRERAYEFITGNGRVVGLPDLRPGDNISLQRLGPRFSGTYYVTKVDHSLGGSGYFTTFDVRRTHEEEA